MSITIIISDPVFVGFKFTMNESDFYANTPEIIIQNTKNALVTQLEGLHLEYLSNLARTRSFHMHNFNLSDYDGIMESPQSSVYVCSCRT